MTKGRARFDRELEPFIAWLNVKDRSAKTVNSYVRSVKHLWSWMVLENDLDLESPFRLETYTSSLCSAYKEWLLSRHHDDGRSSVALKLAGVNSFISHLAELPENADKRIPQKIKTPTVDIADVFTVEDKDMELMQKAAEDPTTKVSAEARAYFWIATDTWQRVGAICSLRVQDVSFEKRQFTFRASRMKQRRALVLESICPQTLPALMTYIRQINPGFLREVDGQAVYLFPGRRTVPSVKEGTGRRMRILPVLTRPMGQARPVQLLMQVAYAAGTSKACQMHITTHAVRRWACTRASASMGIKEIAARSGHRNLIVLMERYIRPKAEREKYTAAISMTNHATESVPLTEPMKSPLNQQDQEFFERLRKLMAFADKL